MKSSYGGSPNNSSPNTPTSQSAPQQGWTRGRITRLLRACAFIDGDVFMHHSTYVGPGDSAEWLRSLKVGDEVDFIARYHEEGQNRWRVLKAVGVGSSGPIKSFIPTPPNRGSRSPSPTPPSFDDPDQVHVRRARSLDSETILHLGGGHGLTLPGLGNNGTNGGMVGHGLNPSEESQPFRVPRPLQEQISSSLSQPHLTFPSSLSRQQHQAQQQQQQPQQPVQQKQVSFDHKYENYMDQISLSSLKRRMNSLQLPGQLSPHNNNNNNTNNNNNNNSNVNMHHHHHHHHQDQMFGLGTSPSSSSSGQSLQLSKIEQALVDISFDSPGSASDPALDDNTLFRRWSADTDPVFIAPVSTGKTSSKPLEFSSLFHSTFAPLRGGI